jgi:hypothetical protein
MQPRRIAILRVAVMLAVMLAGFGLNLANYYVNGKGDRVNSNVNPGNGSTRSSTPIRDQRTNQ